MLQKQAHINENYIVAKHSLLQGSLVIHMAAYAHMQNAGIPSELQQSEEEAHPSLVLPFKYNSSVWALYLFSFQLRYLSRISKPTSVHLH